MTEDRELENVRVFRRRGDVGVFELSEAEGPAATDSAILTEVWLEDVYHLDEIDLSQGRVVIDVGAHMGAVSILAALRGADVIAVEPDRTNFWRLRRHAKINQVPVLAIHAAVGFPQRGVVSSDPETGMGVVTSGASLFRSHDDAQEVDIRALDDLIPEGPIALLKLDVEGGEYAAMQALSFETQERIQHIVLEFHASEDEVVGPMLEKLLETHSVQAFGVPNSGGMIYARRYGT